MRAVVFRVEPEIYVLVVARNAFFEPSAVRTGEYFLIGDLCFPDQFLFNGFHEFLPEMIMLIFINVAGADVSDGIAGVDFKPAPPSPVKPRPDVNQHL